MRNAAFLILVLLSTSSCYQFIPVDDSAPLPQAETEIRIQLNTPQSLDLGTMTLSDVVTVEGHVRNSHADTLGLFSSDLRTAYGFRQRTDGAVFYFDRSQFKTLEQRKLMPARTGVVAGTAVVGLGLFWYFAADLGGGSEEGGSSHTHPNTGRVVSIPLNFVVPLLFP
jgi:hypothetical protein